jgi:hypothetical protein
MHPGCIMAPPATSRLRHEILVGIWAPSSPPPEPPLHVFFSYKHRPTSLSARGLIPGRLCPARAGTYCVCLPTDRHTTPAIRSGPGPSNTPCLSLLHASRLAVLLEEAPLPAALYACRACSHHRVRPSPPHTLVPVSAPGQTYTLFTIAANAEPRDRAVSSGPWSSYDV